MSKVAGPRFEGPWLAAKLASAGCTAAELGRRLNVDRASIHRLIHGTRSIRIDELPILAQAIGVDVEDITAQLGIEPTPTGSKATAACPIVGKVAGDLAVHWEAPKGPKTVKSPAPVDQALVALRFVTTGSPLAAMDGALAFLHKPTGGSGVDAGATLGKICVVKTKKGAWALRVIRRGHTPGHWCLDAIDGSPREDDVQVDAAAPVLWLKLG